MLYYLIVSTNKQIFVEIHISCFIVSEIISLTPIQIYKSRILHIAELKVLIQ